MHTATTAFRSALTPVAPAESDASPVSLSGELTDDDLEHVVGGLERAMQDDVAVHAWLDRRASTPT